MPTPRKSLEEHELTGTKPHYEVTTTNARLTAGQPKFPRGTTREAKALFKRLCKQLAERRALTPGDEHLLTLAATIWDRRQRAQAKLMVEGEIRIYTRLDSNGVERQTEKPNLWLKVASDAERQLVAILDRLGLTPLAGSKVKQTRPAEASEELVPGTMAWYAAQSKEE